MHNFIIRTQSRSSISKQRDTSLNKAIHFLSKKCLRNVNKDKIFCNKGLAEKLMNRFSLAEVFRAQMEQMKEMMATAQGQSTITFH